MKLIITEKQLKKILSKTFDEIHEQGEGESSSATSAKAPTKWESGVTRGPANQIGLTKWSDIVGSTLKRGKGNTLY